MEEGKTHLDGDAVAWFEALDSVADFEDEGAELVAEC